VEFLGWCVEGPAISWVKSLAREHARAALQRTQIESGDIIVINGQATSQGRIVHLSPNLTDTLITTRFHEVFLHNKVNEVESSEVRLYSQTVVQGPDDSLRTYLLKFKAQIWDAGLIIEDQQSLFISLLYNGLRPYLKGMGYRDAKSNARYSTFSDYEAFLTDKEATILLKRSLTPTPPQASRVHHLLQHSPTYSDEDMEADYDDLYGPDTGMLNAFQPRSGSKKEPRKPPVQVIIPGRNGNPPMTVPKRNVAFYLRFETPESDWPQSGTPFTAPLKDNTEKGTKPPIKTQVTMLMKYLVPKIQEETVHAVYDLSKLHNPEWQWCILHGSLAHATHNCPCIKKAFPDRSTEYRKAVKDYKSGVRRLQAGEVSESDDEE
jgi:hypothetical protein